MLGIKQEIGDLKVVLIETGVDVGPAIYLARAFNTDIDTVVKFFILILIFVFDPMAVSLILAYNKVLEEDRKKIISKPKKRSNLKNTETIYNRVKLPEVKKVTEPEVKTVTENVKQKFVGKGGKTPGK